MANWCLNVVDFHGDTETMTQLKSVFAAMADKQEEEGCGQLPDFIEERTGYFFNIRWEDDTLYYETRWVPNTEMLQTIAARYGVGFILDYSEPEMWVVGRAVYEHRILIDTSLEAEDFETYVYQDHNDTWLFEGREYETREEILEILLKRKLDKQ